jgi:hypothetical protein
VGVIHEHGSPQPGLLLESAARESSVHRHVSVAQESSSLTDACLHGCDLHEQGGYLWRGLQVWQVSAVHIDHQIPPEFVHSCTTHVPDMMLSVICSSTSHLNRSSCMQAGVQDRASGGLRSGEWRCSEKGRGDGS